MSNAHFIPTFSSKIMHDNSSCFKINNISLNNEMFWEPEIHDQKLLRIINFLKPKASGTKSRTTYVSLGGATMSHFCLKKGIKDLIQSVP